MAAVTRQLISVQAAHLSTIIFMIPTGIKWKVSCRVRQGFGTVSTLETLILCHEHSDEMSAMERQC